MAKKFNGLGFTLIELLVVTSIIGILSAIGLIFYNGVQTKTLDSTRKRDLHNLATALELYYQQNNRYVVNSDLSDLRTCQIDPRSSTFYNAIKNNMSEGVVPTDPSKKLSDASIKQAYCYLSEMSGQAFRLFAALENCNSSGGNLCGESWNYTVYSDNLTTAASVPSSGAACLTLTSLTTTSGPTCKAAAGTTIINSTAYVNCPPSNSDYSYYLLSNCNTANLCYTTSLNYWNSATDTGNGANANFTTSACSGSTIVNMRLHQP